MSKKSYFLTLGVTLFVFCLLTLGCDISSNSRIIKDIEKEGLVGDVLLIDDGYKIKIFDNDGWLKKVITKSFFGSSFTEEEFLREEGKLIEIKGLKYDEYSNSLVEYSDVHFYNSVGLLTKIERFPKGNDSKITEFEYNNKGQKVRVKETTNDDITIQVFEYDGTILKKDEIETIRGDIKTLETSFYDKKGNVSRWEFSDFQNKSASVFTYDNNNNRIKQEFRNSKGNVVREFNYEFDSKGNWVNLITKENNETSRVSRKVHYSNEDLNSLLANFNTQKNTALNKVKNHNNNSGFENQKENPSPRYSVKSFGNQTVTCPKCQGKGKEMCHKCMGKGDVICTVCRGRGTYFDSTGERKTCYYCNGNLRIPCERCYGKGYSGDCRTCRGYGVVEG